MNDLEPVMRHLEQGGIAVIPADGLGTGLSQLPQRAPLLFSFLENEIASLAQL